MEINGRLGWQSDFIRRQPTLEEVTVVNPSLDCLQTIMKLPNLRSVKIEFEREKGYEVPVLPALRAKQKDAAYLECIISGNGVRIVSSESSLSLCPFVVDTEICCVNSM